MFVVHTLEVRSNVKAKGSVRAHTACFTVGLLQCTWCAVITSTVWFVHLLDLVWEQVFVYDRCVLCCRCEACVWPMMVVNGRWSCEWVCDKRMVCCVWQVCAVISIFFIIVSILSFCLKTHPSFQIPTITYNLSLAVAAAAAGSAGDLDPDTISTSSPYPNVLVKTGANPHEVWFWISCYYCQIIRIIL